MADVKISDFPYYAGIIADTDSMTGLISGPLNYNYTYQVLSENIHGYDPLANVVYVGTGSTLRYSTVYDAWEDLKTLPLASSVNIVCVNTGDPEPSTPIEINAGDPALSIRIANNVSKDFADCRIVAGAGADVVLEMNSGAGSVIKWNPTADGFTFIDMSSNAPNSLRFRSDNLVIENLASNTFSNCNTMNLSPATDDVVVKFGFLNVVFPSNNGSACNFKNTTIDTFLAIALAGSNASNLLFNQGYLIVDKLICDGGFSNLIYVGQINNKAVINSFINNTTALNLTIGSVGGSVNNLMGSTKVTMFGDELNNIVPMVSNASDVLIEFNPTGFGTADNSAGLISNALISNISNVFSATGAFKFSNCVFNTEYNWENSGFVLQASNCQFKSTWKIIYSNQLVTNGFAGTSQVTTGSSLQVSGGSNSVVVGTTGESAFSDSGTDTEQGFNTTLA